MAFLGERPAYAVLPHIISAYKNQGMKPIGLSFQKVNYSFLVSTIILHLATRLGSVATEETRFTFGGIPIKHFHKR